MSSNPLLELVRGGLSGMRVGSQPIRLLPAHSSPRSLTTWKPTPAPPVTPRSSLPSELLRHVNDYILPAAARLNKPIALRRD